MKDLITAMCGDFATKAAVSLPDITDQQRRCSVIPDRQYYGVVRRAAFPDAGDSFGCCKDPIMQLTDSHEQRRAAVWFMTYSTDGCMVDMIYCGDKARAPAIAMQRAFILIGNGSPSPSWSPNLEKCPSHARSCRDVSQLPGLEMPETLMPWCGTYFSADDSGPVLRRIPRPAKGWPTHEQLLESDLRGPE